MEEVLMKQVERKVLARLLVIPIITLGMINLRARTGERVLVLT
jgi:hypothetical protein